MGQDAMEEGQLRSIYDDDSIAYYKTVLRADEYFTKDILVTFIPSRSTACQAGTKSQIMQVQRSTGWCCGTR